jgi:hypothetical protein
MAIPGGASGWLTCAAALAALGALSCSEVPRSGDCAAGTASCAGADDDGEQDQDPIAGDGDASDDGSDAPDGIPCAVEDVLRAHCTSCHASPPQFGAPMPLTSHASFTAASKTDPGRKVHELVKERLHHDDPALRMPPASQSALSADELAVLDAWLDAGALASDEACVPDGDGDAPIDDGDGDEIDREDLECFPLLAHAQGDAKQPYPVGSARDAYVNFSFEAPWDGAGYGIVLNPLIDNTQVIHHWLLFQQNGGVVDGAITDSNGTHPSGELVYVWTPGGGPMDYRDHGDVGFEFPAGAGFDLEIHYNSDDASAVDASGVEVCVQKKKPQNLAAVSWLGRDWFVYVNQQTSVCNPRDDGPIHVLAVSPHMHLQGKHMKGVINRANGATEVIHDAPFSFHDQAWYPKDLMIMPGDTITTTCTWNGFVSFGTDTAEEMCYLFTVAYPKGALSDGLPAGATAHGSSACLGL